MPETMTPAQFREQAASKRAEAQRLAREADGLLLEARHLECAAEEAQREANAAIPVDRGAVQLSGGGEVTPEHRELKPGGQQKGYIVLTPEERAKGFVRPVRRSYIHAGPSGPEGPLRDLTADEAERYSDAGYVKYEPYPPERRPALGRFWTQEQLDKIGKGCRTVTRMSQDIAETYARDPKFYGATFCCGCGTHLPVNEFVWQDDPDQRVGS